MKVLISIHAPARGATHKRLTSEDKLANFNPRSREGSDSGKGHIVARKKDFNPRSREGSDGFEGYYQISNKDFNPRSREGSDPD